MMGGLQHGKPCTISEGLSIGRDRATDNEFFTPRFQQTGTSGGSCSA